MSDIPAYIGMRRLCELVDMSDDTIRRRMKDAGFPKRKPGGKWKWKEVEAWMDGRRRREIRSPVDEERQLKEIEDASAAYFSTHH